MRILDKLNALLFVAILIIGIGIGYNYVNNTLQTELPEFLRKEPEGCTSTFTDAYTKSTFYAIDKDGTEIIVGECSVNPAAQCCLALVQNSYNGAHITLSSVSELNGEIVYHCIVDGTTFEVIYCNGFAYAKF